MRPNRVGSWLIVVGVAVACGSAARAEESDLWSEMARRDLTFVHETLAAQHPGPLNTDDPRFARWQREGFEQALADLGKVHRYGDYRAVLRRYVAGFRDGHLTLDLFLDYRVAGWPGFVTTWRGDGFLVHAVEPGRTQPRVGDRLVSCDGQDAERLFASRVLPFAGNGTASDRFLLAPELLIDRVNPLVEAPKSCAFERSGESVDVPLEWSWPRLTVLEPLIAAAAVGQRGSFDSGDVAGNGLWISLPTFGPGGDDLDRMKAIMGGLAGRRDRDYVVVDVRGNGGGSSYWAEAFVRGLYGDAYYESLQPDGGAYAVYRVSDENIEHFRQLLPSIEEQAGRDSDFYRYFDELVRGLQQSREKSEALFEYREDEPDPGAERGDPPQPLFHGTVYFLTDSVCASACLDFADVVLPLPGVVHVGQPTNADAAYMEVRNKRLPSGNGALNFATKFYRGRKRGHNQDYTPAHAWNDDLWKTEDLERWILGLQRAQTHRGVE